MVLADYYVPGYKAGGAVRSLVNIMGRLGDRLDFAVVTRNRDLGEGDPYPGIEPGRWLRQGPVAMHYASQSPMLFWKVYRALRGERYDALYLNSFFSPHFTLFPLLFLRLGLLRRARTVLAPRGELTEGALLIKSAKKKSFLPVAKALGLYHGVVFQASSELEAADIRRVLGGGTEVRIAPDLPIPGAQVPEREREKARDSLRVVYVARISRNKNLLGALEVLAGMRLPIEFDIYGPLEDPAYWSECRRVMEACASVKVRHRGALKPDEVMPAMAGYDLLFLPTHGENFGHVILEALSAGCPVLLSDRTPWTGVEKAGVGWSLPLADTEAFRSVLETCFRMDTRPHQEMVRRAYAYAYAHLRAEREEMLNVDLLAGDLAREKGQEKVAAGGKGAV